MAHDFGGQVPQVDGIGGTGPSALSGLGLSPQTLAASGLSGGGTNPLSAIGLGNGGSTLSPLSRGAARTGGTTEAIMLLLEELMQMLQGGGLGGGQQALQALAGGAPQGAGGGAPQGIGGTQGGGGSSGGAGGGSVGPLTSAVGQAPENAQAMYKYFTSQGLSPNAAAGIIGNIAQESGGNPESVGSGGNGLIGWTPPLAGAVTGNPQRDLAFQLPAVMKYINQNGSVADINAHASSPSAAAAYFMNKYERPAPATENAAHRETAANAVATMYA